MNALSVVLVLALVVARGLVPAAASPGDPVTLRGTLAWPAILANEPFLVLRADDGRFYSADVTAAQPRGNTALRAGDRISFVGVEGARPHEVTVTGWGPEEPTAPPAGRDAAASPRTESGAPPPPAPANERPWERVHGTVQSVSGHTIVVRRDDGQRVDVDVSRLDGTMATQVRPGQVVTVFGSTEPGRPFTAVGLVHSEPGN